MATRRALQFDDLNRGDTIQVATLGGTVQEGVFMGFDAHRDHDGRYYVMVLEQTLPHGTGTVYGRIVTAAITRVRLIRCAQH